MSKRSEVLFDHIADYLWAPTTIKQNWQRTKTAVVAAVMAVAAVAAVAVAMAVVTAMGMGMVTTTGIYHR